MASEIVDRGVMAGRTALITGASSGIGAHLARLMADQGARVALTARRTGLIEDLAAELRADGAEAIAVPMDVVDGDSVRDGFERAEHALGAVDTLICNAGVSRHGRSTELSESDIRQVFDTNLLGVHQTCTEAARRMIAAGSRKSGAGRIVLIGSITAQMTGQGDAAYAASKAGAEHLARQLAREWVRMGINVNTVRPGYVKTELLGDWFASEAGQAQVASWPRRRLLGIGSLDEIVLFLAGDKSSHVTGTAIAIDDGQSL